MGTRKKVRRRGRKGEGMLFQRGRVWWFKAPNGERLSTGTSIESEAVDFKLRKLAELRLGQPHIKTPVRGATVNELLDAHLAYMRRMGRRSTTTVEQVLTKHVRPYFGERVASTLTTADFERYREDKKDEIEPTTINRHLSHLRSGYVTGHRRVTPRLVDFVPAFPLVDESYNVRQGFLSFDGYRKVREHLPASLVPLFVVAFHVSSRRGELLKIKWSQVDLKEGLIVLSPFDTKNKTGRALPIYGDMVEVLKEQKRVRDEQYSHRDHVFFWRAEDVMLVNGGARTAPGSPIREFRKSWANAVKSAGFPKLLFHDLRRTAERNMAKAGMDQTMRMRISGHKTPSMSTRYNIVVAEDIAEEKARMDAWFRNQSAARSNASAES